MRRTITIILTGILTVITALSGCSNSNKKETKKPDKNTIKFATFYSDKDQGAMYKEIAKAFEKANDKIKVEVITDYSDDKVKESLSQKGDVDIIGLRRDQIVEFSKSGYLKDMSDFIDEKGLNSKLYKISLAYGKYNGKTYGIGDMPVTMEWFYNTDMFSKYNVPVPTNLSQLLSASSKFKSRNITPMAVGAMDGWTLAAIFGMITSQTTGVSEFTSNFGSDADAFKNIPGVQDAFTIYGKLVDTAIPKNSIDINYRQSVDDFVKGKAAMLPALSTTSTLIEQIKPTGLNYSVFETPVSFVDEPKASVSATGGQVIALPSNSKRNEDAQKFIEFLFSEEAQKIIVEKGYMSSVIAANTKESDIKERVASHLEMTNDNSIMLMDNLEPAMADNTTRILQDILEGRVKASEGWKRILKLTFQ